MIPGPWQKYLQSRREERTSANLVRKLRHLRHMGSTHVQLGSRNLINFASNDYLGLAGDLRIAEAAAAAAGRYGWGTGASRLVTGSSILHQKLEQDLARYRGTEAALLFGSGYQANLGVISALVGPGDVVLSDAMNHASIVAGCRLSGASVRVFGHLDYDDLDRQLAGGGKGRKLVVTDSLFSIEGDVADLPRIVKLCERHGALLMLDEAHANGTLGRQGRGIAEIQGVAHNVPIVVGNFSKALGSHGGFVTCSEEIREHLVNESRPFIYTTSTPLALTAANIEALRILTVEGAALRQRLAANTRLLRSRLKSLDFELSGQHHIIGVHVGSPGPATSMADEIENLGMLIYPMRWPSMPKGEDTLRISVSAAHTEEEITRLATALRIARDHAGGRITAKVHKREARRPSHHALDVAGEGDLDESAFADESEGSQSDVPAMDDVQEGYPEEVAAGISDDSAPELDRISSGRLPVVESSESGGFQALLDDAFEAGENSVQVVEVADQPQPVVDEAVVDDFPEPTDSGAAIEPSNQDNTFAGTEVAPESAPESAPVEEVDAAPVAEPAAAEPAEIVAVATPEAVPEVAESAAGDPLIAEIARGTGHIRRDKTRRTTKRTSKHTRRR